MIQHLVVFDILDERLMHLLDRDSHAYAFAKDVIRRAADLTPKISNTDYEFVDCVTTYDRKVVAVVNSDGYFFCLLMPTIRDVLRDLGYNIEVYEGHESDIDTAIVTVSSDLSINELPLFIDVGTPDYYIFKEINLIRKNIVGLRLPTMFGSDSPYYLMEAEIGDRIFIKFKTEYAFREDLPYPQFLNVIDDPLNLERLGVFKVELFYPFDEVRISFPNNTNPI